METVLEEWKGNCDCIYLYANDSVVNFYPKFGFVSAYEYRYHVPTTKKDGVFRKLDMSISLYPPIASAALQIKSAV